MAMMSDHTKLQYLKATISDVPALKAIEQQEFMMQKGITSATGGRGAGAGAITYAPMSYSTFLQMVVDKCSVIDTYPTSRKMNVNVHVLCQHGDMMDGVKQISSRSTNYTNHIDNHGYLNVHLNEGKYEDDSFQCVTYEINNSV